MVLGMVFLFVVSGNVCVVVVGVGIGVGISVGV